MDTSLTPSSAVPSLLLSPGGGSALNTPISKLPPPVAIPSLGSSVYHYQCKLFAATHHSATSSSSSPASLAFPCAGHDMLGGGGEAAGLSTRKSKGTKYRGVKQQREGKWRAEIRKPQSRWRAYIGTYDSPETAAYAYDRAAYRLLGEHARPNFPGIMNRPGDDGFPEALRHLRDAVDAKFQDDGVIVPGRRTQAKEGHLHESKHARAGERRESAQAASPAPARPVLSGNDATSAETTTTSLYGPFEVLFSVDDSERLLEELMASADMELELMPSADVELEPIPSADVTSAETTTTSLYGPFEVPFSVDDVERLLEELMPSADVELEPIPSADVDLKAMPFDDMVLMWELMD